MRPHVDAPCRLVEDQELRFGQEPARQQHLLLVAAREKFDGLFGARGADPQLANKALGNGVLLFTRDWPQPAALGLQGQNDVFTHGGRGNNPVGFAIFRAEADPEAGGLMRRTQRLGFAFDQRSARVGRFNAEDHLCGFGTA